MKGMALDSELREVVAAALYKAEWGHDTELPPWHHGLPDWLNAEAYRQKADAVLAALRLDDNPGGPKDWPVLHVRLKLPLGGNGAVKVRAGSVDGPEVGYYAGGSHPADQSEIALWLRVDPAALIAAYTATEEGGPGSYSKPAPIPHGEPQNRVPDSVQKKGNDLDN